ncbi:MAG: 23S rRNA (pseudouridine(1915)-N(3))-methyltransferase RlmH [Christensenellales bacterium]
MQRINFICIGKLKESYWLEAQTEYTTRLSAFARTFIIEKKEAALPKNASAAQIQKAVREEGKSLLLASSGAFIALSPEGKPFSSEGFSKLLLTMLDCGDISFAIGGSHGLSDEVKKAADHVISFSPMTMPHQLFRVVLLEQVYRALMLGSGRAYHK